MDRAVSGEVKQGYRFARPWRGARQEGRRSGNRWHHPPPVSGLLGLSHGGHVREGDALNQDKARWIWRPGSSDR